MAITVIIIIIIKLCVHCCGVVEESSCVEMKRVICFLVWGCVHWRAGEGDMPRR